MNKKKIIPIFTVFLAIALIALPSVNASPVTIMEVASGNTENPMYYASPYALAQTLTVGASDTRLTEVQFLLSKSGSPTGTLMCKLYTAPSDIPATYLATSNYFYNIASLQSGGYENAQWINFTFSNTDTWLTATQKYAVVIELLGSAATINNTNYVAAWYQDFSLVTGSKCTFGTGTWTAQGSHDLRVKIYGDSTASPTPTPDPTPTPTPTDDYKWDENTNSWSWWNGTHWIPSSGPASTANPTIVTFTGNMITYIVPLALLLLPAIVGAWALGRAGAAKWGFIAGLNIGAIMCYLYLPTFGLWAVIAIVLVDVLMIFASQRGE